ncbi:hypothetical protein [Bradyrhizobium sp.]|uniref:hypothetical protein n=1 Tax=Bradyrhizobium sp. TaxID=376 RepID=UPI003C3D3623
MRAIGIPRICIGAVFALAEAQIMLATVLPRYTIAMDSRRPVLPARASEHPAKPRCDVQA